MVGAVVSAEIDVVGIGYEVLYVADLVVVEICIAFALFITASRYCVVSHA